MRPGGSLYLRLTLLFGATLAAVVVVLWAGVSGGFSLGRNQALQHNLDHYADRLAAEIGAPPDETLARALSRELELDIGWDGPAGTGSTVEGHLPHRGRELIGRFGGWTFTFVPRTPLVAPNWAGLGLALPVAALVLMAGWWGLRRLLVPLGNLARLGSTLGLDGWTARVPVTGTGELQDLARTFNAMADRIEGYWKSQQELLAAVSHELRSPLTRMRVSLEFFPEGKARTGMEDDIRRLDRMTGILLERERLAQRPDLLHREVTDLGPWVSDITAPFLSQGMELTQGGPELTLALDRGRAALAVTNLLENCWRHAAGTPVTVRWRVDGAEAVVTITDGGPGLPEDRLSRWGEPFRPGLGSSLVKSIAAAHGGSVEVANATPRGLAVSLRLPR
jgi:signal transduction histidine kinase